MMKKILLTSIVSVLAASWAVAIDIPKGVFRVDEVSKAQTEAAEAELAVAYIMFPENIKIS